MRVAAIDVGTNSIHLLVADISPHGDVRIVEKAREQVELGAGGLGLSRDRAPGPDDTPPPAERSRITEEAFARGVAALVTFKQAADGLGAEDVHAAATSAVREASNGGEFVKAVRARTGIHIRTISGVEEARLIHLGVRADLDFSAGPVLLMDLGGGSVEFILCDQDAARASISLPLGHIRLAEAFHRSDPFRKEEIKRLRAWVRDQLAPLLKRVQPGTFTTMVGTSGAVRTLGRMSTLLRGETLPEHAHGLVLHRAELDELIRLFSTRKQARYGALPGMDTKRRRTLPAAAVFVREVMEVLQQPLLQTSERSLRDGLIVDWVMRHAPEIQLSRTVARPRMRSVLRTMERYGVDEAHARKVAELSLQLFDGTAEVHGLDARDRRMLEYAALLHDVGHHIAGQDHNKHGAYLIRHTRMYGFTAPEMAVLTNLVRYHRGSMPKRKHETYRTLPRADRRRVRVLSGILRIADGLDRSHSQPVHELQVAVHPDRIQVLAQTVEEAHIERWAVERRRQLLQEALQRRIDVALRHPSEAP